MAEIAEGMCACGEPLHYKSDVSKEFTARRIKAEGEFVDISTPMGTWRVQRHFVALHSPLARDLPAFAEQYGFERVGDGSAAP